LKTAFLAELPRLPLTWFDDSFEMPDWSSAKRGFIQTSPAFRDEAMRASERSWPVVRLEGTHLHPAFALEETAAALLDVCRYLSAI
ncbi:MAG: alpha/beta hydrolase, partial [Nitratireductor sp.]